MAFAVTVAVLVLGGTTADRTGSGSGQSRAAQAASYTTFASKALQAARGTDDPAPYARADAALRRALALAPGDAGALTERGVLRLARHDFSGALLDARAARAAAPDVNKPFGVLVDSLVELGRYREAGRALQEMVDRKPNLDAYARVSYFRELHGDLPGAAQALRLAISAGGAVPENEAYVRALLGDLWLVRGRPQLAERSYRMALAVVPRHPPSLFGLARVDAARGHLALSIRRLRPLVDRLPVPAYIVALAETELAAGRRAAARRDLASMPAQARLLAAAGVDTDTEMAVFEADRGSPARAVALGRRAWRAAPSVRSADALGWALTAAGRPREGLAWARRSLRLGSKDPSFLFHAGIAAARAGRDSEARELLGRLLRQAPEFSPLRAPEARRALRALG